MLPENVNWNAVLQSITDTWLPLIGMVAGIILVARLQSIQEACARTLHIKSHRILTTCMISDDRRSCREMMIRGSRSGQDNLYFFRIQVRFLEQLLHGPYTHVRESYALPFQYPALIIFARGVIRRWLSYRVIR